MTTFASKYNQKNIMYILVNKRPLNALFLQVGEIKKFDKKELDTICCFISGNNSPSGAIYSSILNDAIKKNICKVEKKITFIDDKYPHTEEERTCLEERYYFIVRDSHYFVCSDFYETEAAAEEARDKLLLIANKIIGRLHKVEI
jgi:hypothetical protein